jgi:two-component system, chemotaxis family, protein-glutamate methylesterase/glutaminase
MESARYRCRVGHAWTADALLEARALLAAVRTLDEKAGLAPTAESTEASG